MTDTQDNSPMLMKEGLNLAAIEHLARVFSTAWPAFPSKTFIQLASVDLEALALKQRVQQIIQALGQTLPQPFPNAVPVLDAFTQHWQVADANATLRGFPVWPVTDYVAEFGLDHPEQALAILKQLTGLFSAEFALRPFVMQHFELTYHTLGQWLDDPDPHVRRLISEGTRPRLPWGVQLPHLVNNPEPSLPFLEQLVDDDSDYVRRSVANHLNDIAKDHPDQVIKTCQYWLQTQTAQNQKKRDWVIRHATRTLVKQGHPEVFALLGYETEPQLKVGLTLAPNSLVLGEPLRFNLQLDSLSNRPQKLVLDYAIHHVKANGRRTAKVFKLKNLCLKQTEHLNKQHPIKPITTRKYYSGWHKLEILVNGQAMAEAEFYLQVSE